MAYLKGQIDRKALKPFLVCDLEGEKRLEWEQGWKDLDTLLRHEDGKTAMPSKEPAKRGPFKARKSPLGWTVVLVEAAQVWWQNRNQEEAEMCAAALNRAWALGASGEVPKPSDRDWTSTQMKEAELPKRGEQP